MYIARLVFLLIGCACKSNGKIKARGFLPIPRAPTKAPLQIKYGNKSNYTLVFLKYMQENKELFFLFYFIYFIYFYYLEGCRGQYDPTSP